MMWEEWPMISAMDNPIKWEFHISNAGFTEPQNDIDVSEHALPNLVKLRRVWWRFVKWMRRFHENQ